MVNISYKKLAEEILEREIEGIAAVKDILGSDFDRLVDRVVNLQGRVIISGMGKSGHIARKIAATMASIGTPAFFIHPGEASHGDLGMVTKDDLVILLSNSGETKELSDIINYCKRFNIFLVGIVRRKTSLLVEASDIAMVLPEIAEASDVGAPTTSTTMMLALGDALAVVAAKVKGFSKGDFSVFHPGGKIGSSFIKVKKLMRKGEDLPLVLKDDLMSEVLVEMTAKSMGCAAVVSKQGELEGIITDGDLRRHMSDKLLSLKASDLMTSNPKTVKEESLAVEAVAIMNKFNITNLFVIEGNKLSGVVHIHDCFKAGII